MTRGTLWSSDIRFFAPLVPGLRVVAQRIRLTGFETLLSPPVKGIRAMVQERGHTVTLRARG